MSKRKHNLIIVCVLFALLLGVLFLLISMPAAPKENSENESKTNLSKVIDLSDKSILGIQIKNSSGQYDIKSIEKDDKKIYILSDEDADKTYENMTSVLVDTLINLKPTQIVLEDTDDFSKYGLEVSRAEITVNFDNGDKTTLELGDDAPLSKGAYMKIKGDNKIYLISETDKEIFLNEKTFYEKTE